MSIAVKCISDRIQKSKEKKSTYKGKATADIHGGSANIVKVELFRETLVPVVVHHVSNGMQCGPEDDGHTQPAVQGQDLSVGKAQSVEHGATKDENKYDAAGGNGTVATSIADDHCVWERKLNVLYTKGEKEVVGVAC